MTNEDPRLVELPVRLSKSQLWQIQKNYFTSMGVKAWKEEVPFYISSNAFIGQRYALQVINYLKDLYHLQPALKDQIFYIFELGSGTGKFSFHFLKSFKKLLHDYQLSTSFCYVITDVIEENIQFCMENPCFQPFIEAQELDFSSFNVEQDNDFYMKLRKITYSDLKSQTPLIVLANYTFDCIKQDAFESHEGKLQELRVGLRSRFKNFDVKKGLHLNELKLNFQLNNMHLEHYYEKPVLNKILRDYQDLFTDKNAMFLMPLGAFQFMDNLAELTQNQYFMVVGDKGISNLENFSLLKDHHRVTYDGCYSFLVNFDAMGKYIHSSGGDYLLSGHNNIFKINLYSMGISFSTLSNTKAYFENFLESTGPDEYCYIFDEFLTSSYRFQLKALISFLRFSEWDPNAYAIVHERVIELISGASDILIADIKKDLQKVKENIYQMNIGDDIYMLIGIFYQCLNMDEEALEVYHQSIAIFGDKGVTHNNIAVIYEKQNKLAKALEHYSKSYEVDKNNTFAKRKIYRLTDRPYLAAVIPIFKGLLILLLVGVILYFTKG